MQLTAHFSLLDELQLKHGSKSLHAIYGAGCIKNPELMLIFMNPTARNISSDLEWKGLRAPWLGTKNIWKLLNKLNLIDIQITSQILNLKPNEWDSNFALSLYSYISNNSIYITNLAKCTQADASHLSNSVFKDYLNQTLDEIYTINPKKIITFGGQVSSILLNKPIKVSNYLEDEYENLKIKEKGFKVYPSYYPVGQGMRNIGKAPNRIANVIKI